MAKKKILIVEDNAQNMKVVLMTLRNQGYSLLAAADGEAALKIAAQENPDLIIMDIKLPKMDGLEITRRLRRTPAFRHTPIIALTAHAMKGDRRHIIAAGCDLYLTKPINTRTLPGIIKGMLS